MIVSDLSLCLRNFRCNGEQGVIFFEVLVVFCSRYALAFLTQREKERPISIEGSEKEV